MPKDLLQCPSLLVIAKIEHLLHELRCLPPLPQVAQQRCLASAAHSPQQQHIVPQQQLLQLSLQAIARACFEWVRDEIGHSFDYQLNPVTCRASEVLQQKTGYCFAKSHLLAALLRANQIPAGFCYQRLSIDDKGGPYSLHGFNTLYLPDIGWYRVNARGNKAGVNAQFTPPQEPLVYKIQLPEEADFPDSCRTALDCRRSAASTKYVGCSAA
jgi:hypothetical protein